MFGGWVCRKMVCRKMI
uniref:Uncharacterized protein n=1 Tax=Arundo donax TaxID=35708 RepID=A0A0A8YD54_ARUDO